MHVFKFGGASVKDADAIRNVGRILAQHREKKLVVVVSAMGKTTNALESIVDAFYNNEENASDLLKDLSEAHWDILNALFEPEEKVFESIKQILDWIPEFFKYNKSRNYNYIYDQVVSQGEMLSTRIISAWLTKEGITNTWLDARDIISTDHSYTEAQVNWTQTESAIQRLVMPKLELGPIITQGFIGSTSEGLSTTLGREGSDYTASIISFCLDAQKMTIWKDVPGVLNADPKQFPDAQLIEEISYREASEMTFYGAKVIHPKTIKPLQNKNIPLEVRSFLNFGDPGTMVKADGFTKDIPPVIVHKLDQVLISFTPKDFSFIQEETLSHILAAFGKYQMRIRMMHNGAISFSACVDDNKEKIKAVIQELETEFEIKRNEGLELLTIRHYTEAVIEKMLSDKEVVLEEKTRSTIQVLMR